MNKNFFKYQQKEKRVNWMLPKVLIIFAILFAIHTEINYFVEKISDSINLTNKTLLKVMEILNESQEAAGLKIAK